MFRVNLWQWLGDKLVAAGHACYARARRILDKMDGRDG